MSSVFWVFSKEKSLVKSPFGVSFWENQQLGPGIFWHRSEVGTDDHAARDSGGLKTDWLGLGMTELWAILAVLSC